MKNYTIILLLLLFHQKVSSQCTTNFLLNPGFETPLQTGNTNGNNFPNTNPWGSWTMPGLGSNAFNVIRVNGTGYGGGPNNAQEGIQYLDINSNSGTVTQNFTLNCVANITFSGWFSSRESSPGYTNWASLIEIVDASNVVVASSTSRNFTNADGDGNPGDAIWYQVTGAATGLPAGTYTYRVIMGDYANFDNAFLCASPNCLVLPVKLVSFSGEYTNQANLLRWKITDAVNLSRFTIERSIDGISFSRVEDLPVTGSSQSDFSFTDRALPNTNTWFYRLKLVDIDGSYKYSSVIKLKSGLQQQAALSVYPNPVTGQQVNVFVQSAERYPAARLSLTDLAGGELGSKSVAVERGVNNFVLNTPAVSAGIYLLKLKLPDNQLIIKINIQ